MVTVSAAVSSRRTLSALGAALLAGLLSGTAHAAGPVVTHNTGQGLAAGAADPNYTYSFAGTPGATGQAVVLSPANYWMGDGGLPYPWDTSNLSTYAWVSTQDSNFPKPQNAPNTEIDYSTTFSLTDPLGYTLTGLYEADDSSLGVFLNGVLIPGTALPSGNVTNGSPWTTPHGFSASSGLVAGTNTLTFKTIAEDNFTNGFRAQYGVNAVPEASTNASFGLLLALGLGGVVLAAKKKKAAASV